MDIALFILVHRYLHRVLLRHLDCPLLSPPLSYVTCASYYVTLPHCIFWDREFLLFTTFLPPFLPAFRSSCIAPRFQPHYPILKAASFSSTIAENSFSVRAAFFKFQIETPDDESLFNRYFVRIFSSLSCFFSFLFSDTTLIRFTRDDNAADLLTPPLPAPSLRSHVATNFRQKVIIDLQLAPEVVGGCQLYDTIFQRRYLRQNKPTNQENGNRCYVK